MIDEWRLDDGKLQERALCLTCLTRRGVTTTRKVFEFCHDFTRLNKFEGYMPTEDNPLTEEVAPYGGDYVLLASEKVMEEWNKYTQ